MAARILLVTFQQAMRSVVLTLFPISFIALIAWATAGSASGNTSDPIRAAIWLWLGAHLVPFHLLLAPAFISSSLSYLPIAAAALPFIAIRSGYKRSAELLTNERAARSFVTLWYTLIATLACALVQGQNVKPVLYLVPLYVGSLSLISTIKFEANYFVKFKAIIYSFLTIFGLSLILIATSLSTHFKVVNDLAIVIQPGWVGGVLLLALQVLYLPNIALSAVSYVFGLGFTIGAHTQIDPFTFHLTSLPAIPILGALPTGKNPWLLAGALLLFAAVLFNQINIFRDTFETKARHLEIIKVLAPTSLFILLISYLASGSLVTKELTPVGISWWKLSAALLVVQVVTLIVGLYLPLLVKGLLNRGEVKNNA